MKDKIRDSKLLAETQYKTADNLNARWDLYKYCVPPINIYDKALSDLDLQGNEDILEVGCGDGNVLLSLREQMRHHGRLFGLEINDTIVQSTVDYLQDHPALGMIDFYVGTAEKLPFPDSSLDVILAFFMLYHVPDIQSALAEWKRVLRPNGRILVSTASRFQRPKGKKLKEEMASIAGVKAHPKFSVTFDLENGKEQLEEVFQVVDSYVYEGEMRITDPEIYLRAMDLSRDMYNPAPDDVAWGRARAHTKQTIEGEINNNGYFADTVKRGYFICKKKAF